MNVRQYYRTVLDAIDEAPHVLASDLNFVEINQRECYIRGVLTLSSSVVGHIAEYVVTAPILQRPKYRYHFQWANGEFIVRWDNAPHHRHLATFPHHRHPTSGPPVESVPMDIPSTLTEIVKYLGSK